MSLLINSIFKAPWGDALQANIVSFLSSDEIARTRSVSKVLNTAETTQGGRLLGRELEKCPSFTQLNSFNQEIVQLVAKVSNTGAQRLLLAGLVDASQEPLIITETCKRLGIEKMMPADMYFRLTQESVRSEMFGVGSIGIPFALSFDDCEDYIKKRILAGIENTIKVCRAKEKEFVASIDLSTQFRYKHSYVSHNMNLIIKQTTKGLRIELFDPWGAGALNKTLRPDFHGFSSLLKTWAKKSDYEFVSLPEENISMQFAGDKWEGDGLCYLMCGLYLQLHVVEGLKPSEIKTLMKRLGSLGREKLALQFGKLISADDSEREAAQKRFHTIVKQLRVI